MANDTKAPKLSAAEIEALLAENAALKADKAKTEAASARGIKFAVSKDGALAVYGLTETRFPVQLHRDTWEKLFANMEIIRSGIELHSDKLRTHAAIMAEWRASKAGGTAKPTADTSVPANAVARAAATMAARDANDPNHGK